MSETTCDTCGQALPPDEDGLAVFCSARCYGVSIRAASEGAGDE